MKKLTTILLLLIATKNYAQIDTTRKIPITIVGNVPIEPYFKNLEGTIIFRDYASGKVYKDFDIDIDFDTHWYLNSKEGRYYAIYMQTLMKMYPDDKKKRVTVLRNYIIRIIMPGMENMYAKWKKYDE